MGLDARAFNRVTADSVANISTVGYLSGAVGYAFESSGTVVGAYSGGDSVLIVKYRHN